MLNSSTVCCATLNDRHRKSIVVNSTIALMQSGSVEWAYKPNDPAWKGAEHCMEINSLGQMIRAAREAHGLDQKNLARLVGVAPSQVTRWEADRFAPSPQTLVKVAQQLELSAAELFTLAGIPLPEGTASLPAMLRAEYQLPPEAVAEIQAHIEDVARRYHQDH